MKKSDWMSKLGNWSHLNYWSSGEWQVVEERLTDYEKAGRTYCPSRDLLFRSLELIAPGEVRVCILGQDPYPNPAHASGVAFSVPPSIRAGSLPLPATLKNIFAEYSSDLGYPTPKNGDLTKWVSQGVLLWNVYPSCSKGRPGSHHWPEWELLTQEILHELTRVSPRPVTCCLGGASRKFLNHCSHRDACSPDPLSGGSQTSDLVIATSHPAPRGVEHGFRGSKIFSRINALLDKPIDWRLE